MIHGHDPGDGAFLFMPSDLVGIDEVSQKGIGMKAESRFGPILNIPEPLMLGVGFKQFNQVHTGLEQVQFVDAIFLQSLTGKIVKIGDRAGDLFLVVFVENGMFRSRLVGAASIEGSEGELQGRFGQYGTETSVGQGHVFIAHRIETSSDDVELMGWIVF